MAWLKEEEDNKDVNKFTSKSTHQSNISTASPLKGKTLCQTYWWLVKFCESHHFKVRDGSVNMFKWPGKCFYNFHQASFSRGQFRPLVHLERIDFSFFCFGLTFTYCCWQIIEIIKLHLRWVIQSNHSPIAHCHLAVVLESSSSSSLSSHLAITITLVLPTNTSCFYFHKYENTFQMISNS